MTYPRGSGATQLSLKATLKRSGVGGRIGVVEVDQSGDAEEDGEKGADHDQTGSGGGPGVLPGRKDTQHIVILVDGLAKVSSLLGIPPSAVGVTELTLDGGWVDVAAVLRYYPSAPRLVLSALPDFTDHSGILGLGQAGAIGVLGVDDLLVGVRMGEEGSSLDGGQ